MCSSLFSSLCFFDLLVARMDSDLSSISPVRSVVDVSQSLFLSTSDTPRIVLTPHILVDSNNYLIWSSSLYNALLAKNKHRFIDGTCRLE